MEFRNGETGETWRKVDFFRFSLHVPWNGGFAQVRDHDVTGDSVFCSESHNAPCSNDLKAFFLVLCPMCVCVCVCVCMCVCVCVCLRVCFYLCA